MKISLEWLSQYVDITGLAPEAIAEALTASGLEVEAVERLGGKFSGVVVAKCLKLDPHPNADKLRLATVDLGDRTQQVVCGAQNLAEGMTIAFALEGAQVINRKDGSLFTLGKATIRGVESSGMICSIDELGLQDRYPKTEDGIWPIGDVVADSPLGQDLKQALGLLDDVILHTAPTANRGDQMSMVGVAREVAALFDRPLKLPGIPEFSAQPDQPPLRIQLDDPSVCAYYGGLFVDGASVQPSPAWMVRRIEAAGTRAINLLVDVTNYVMLELGQPLHAFDRERLAGAKTVGVRRARAGEPFTTLDDEAYTLNEQAVVVSVDDAPVALAGVMGGQGTEIVDTSTNLLLEAACFDAAANRKCAKSVGIRTESSARFERGVDPLGVKKALFRCAQLLVELSGARVIGLVESPPPAIALPEITLRLPRLATVIGLSIPVENIVSALGKLGFEITAQSAEALSVRVPSWRLADVTREIDVIEEVIRIYGYDQVPYGLPAKTASVPFSAREQFIGQTHQALQGGGLSQVMTTSLIGESLLEKTGMGVDRTQLVTVVNSHSSDHTLMRQSLLPNLLEVAKYNQSQGSDNVWVYELGKTYFKVAKPADKHAGVNERLYLAALLMGHPSEGVWQTARPVDFYALKGLLEKLLTHLFGANLPPVSIAAGEPPDYLHPGKSAQVMLDGKPVGVLGELHPARMQRLKFKQPVYVLEVNLEPLYKRYQQQAATRQADFAVSPYPAMDRDVALLLSEGVTHQAIVDVIAGLKPEHLTRVTLFDQYQGERLEPGKRSLAYRLTFQSAEGTLTDQAVDATVSAIREALTQQLAVSLR